MESELVAVVRVGGVEVGDLEVHVADVCAGRKIPGELSGREFGEDCVEVERFEWRLTALALRSTTVMRGWRRRCGRWPTPPTASPTPSKRRPDDQHRPTDSTPH
ncbi:MAG: hypothetical protein ABSH51_05085 [Solirubrobacteraceae bacterium]